MILTCLGKSFGTIHIGNFPQLWALPLPAIWCERTLNFKLHHIWYPQKDRKKQFQYILVPLTEFVNASGNAGFSPKVSLHMGKKSWSKKSWNVHLSPLAQLMLLQQKKCMIETSGYDNTEPHQQIQPTQSSAHMRKQGFSAMLARTRFFCWECMVHDSLESHESWSSKSGLTTIVE
jgi:hypothetical protein